METSGESSHNVKCLKMLSTWRGGHETLAGELGVTPQAIYNWAMKKRIPLNHIRKLVELSDGKFEAGDFLPEN